jgi:hypothetical protein
MRVRFSAQSWVRVSRYACKPKREQIREGVWAGGTPALRCNQVRQQTVEFDFLDFLQRSDSGV